ncbi:MAG: GtrA family protein [Pseudomonadota bacterium]
MNSARLSEVMRFITAGGMATLSHWLTMALLIAAGALPALATAVGAVVGAVANYLLQKAYTFRSGHSHHIVLPRYVAACALLWLANLLLFILLHRLFDLSIPPAQLLTTAFVALLSYWLFRSVVFNESR